MGLGFAQIAMGLLIFGLDMLVGVMIDGHRFHFAGYSAEFSQAWVGLGLFLFALLGILLVLIGAMTATLEAFGLETRR